MTDQLGVSAAPRVAYDVRQYDAQREGMAVVSGWQVWAQVTLPNGRTTAPVPIALCPDPTTADEIADLLNAKYGATDAD